ncbi:hypothetical protein [Actinoplanes sp. NPDC049118]|uniref:alpha/beta fold hydrolase n=1 Tax=Actinoplanes sp. NPDC049118 TaxID=3155769 RepID=UPI0033C8A902
MNTFADHDDAELLRQELSAGDPLVPGHGLSPQPDSWEAQLLVPAPTGHRCITHDRRGHGRSTRASRSGALAKAGQAPFLWTTGNAVGLPGEAFDEQCAASLADGPRGRPDVADGPFGADCPGIAPAGPEHVGIDVPV